MVQLHELMSSLSKTSCACTYIGASQIHENEHKYLFIEESDAGFTKPKSVFAGFHFQFVQFKF